MLAPIEAVRLMAILASAECVQRFFKGDGQAKQDRLISKERIVFDCLSTTLMNNTCFRSNRIRFPKR